MNQTNRSFCLPAALAIMVGGPLILGGCYGKQEAKGRDQGPASVGYVVAAYDSAPLTAELAGRISAYEVAEIRPRVSGLVQDRLFNEGAYVKKGQGLYRLSAGTSATAVDEARADLLAAEATRSANAAKAARFKPLADMEAISKQEYADAAAAARLADAQVAQRRAALATARVTLGYTTVTAPISGRIGRSLVTTGALVTQNQTEPMAIVQRIDPVYVDLQQSSAEMLALRKAVAGDGAAPAKVAVRLRLEDGSDYPFAGTMQLTEQVVDPATGSVTLRATFPNPRGLLLPGMYVKAEVAQGLVSNVIRVPQQAVLRDPKGQAYVLVVDDRGQARRVDVVTARTLGTDWIVTSGLNPGMKVITEGLSQAKSGKPVKAKPAMAARVPDGVIPGQSVPATTR